MDITDKEFTALQRYVRDACGINIPPDKCYLIQQRLEPLAREKNCEDFEAFHDLLCREDCQALRDEVVAAISTNETSFFRDAHPFRAFRDHVLPWMGERIKERKRTHQEGHAQPVVRIWSAGSSTGQEPYSLAILIHEYTRSHHYLGIRREDFAILATDISERALTRAKAAAYHHVEMSRGLPEDVRERYFEPSGRNWRLCENIRSMVHFQKMNLMEPGSLMPVCDLILCRNVLIYFDEDTKRSVISYFHRKLQPGGYLMLGSAENLYCLSDRFEHVPVGETILYRKLD